MKLKPQTRFLSTQPSAIDLGARTLTFPFSSELPVKRWYGEEILVHDVNSMDVGRLNNRAPLLFNHGLNDVLGVVERAWVNTEDRRGYTTVRFAKTARADEVLGMVQDGILPNVSFMYRIDAAEENPASGEIRVTRFEPLEISIVTVPADQSVGVGRDFANEETEIQITRVEVVAPQGAATTAQAAKGAIMSEVNTPAAATTADPQTRNDGTESERLRIKAITNLARNHKVDDKTRDDWIDKGVTVDDASAKVLDILAERGRTNPQSVSMVGMSNSETRQYSLTRAINAAFDKDWSKAGLELEAHKLIAQRMGTIAHPNKFYVPLEVQKRDLTAGTGSQGGYLVQTSNVGFIDLLRNRSVVMRMGARTLSGLVGNVTVPRQTTANSVTWLANEAATVTETNAVFGQLSLAPKTVGCYQEISRQLTLQSSPDAESLIMSDLSAVVALAVDAAALNGSGASGQPLGIIGTAGIGGVTGTSIAYAGIIEFQTDVAGGNALSSTCGYVTTPVVAGLLKTRQRFTSTDTPLWQGNILDGTIEGFKAMSSVQVPTGDILFGDFNQVIIAEWGVLEVEVNPYANFQAGIIGIRALYTVDVGVRYAASFSLATSVT